MINSFYNSLYLAHLIDWTRSIQGNLNWFFVSLDSNRNFLTIENKISQDLKREQVDFRFESGGLWLSGCETTKSYIVENLVVPFSACYIFDISIKNCDKPKFNMTTDLGRPFDSFEMSKVVTEINRLGAIGYAADGCGLQWVSDNTEVNNLIGQNFNSWQKLNTKK